MPLRKPFMPQTHTVPDFRLGLEPDFRLGLDLPTHPLLSMQVRLIEQKIALERETQTAKDRTAWVNPRAPPRQTGMLAESAFLHILCLPAGATDRVKG